MLAIFPVSSKTAPLLEQYTLVLAKLGPNDIHQLLVIACPSAAAAAQQFAEANARLFAKSECIVLPSVIGPGFSGRNQLFKASALAAQERNQPWIWMEDAYPWNRGWLSSLQEEYNTVGKPFLGVIEDTYEKVSPETAKKAGLSPDEPHFVHKGKHMRFGIYPADYASRSMLLDYLAAKKFEYFLQEEIVHKCAQSARMRSIWASANFRRKDSGGPIIADKTDESEIREVKTIYPSEDLMVIHGCRDGTLGMVVLSRNLAAMGTSRPRPVGQSVASEEKLLENLNDDLQTARARLAEALTRIETLEKENVRMASQIGTLTEARESLGQQNLELRVKLAAFEEGASASSDEDEDSPSAPNPPKKKRRGRPPKQKQPALTN